MTLVSDWCLPTGRHQRVKVVSAEAAAAADARRVVLVGLVTAPGAWEVGVRRVVQQYESGRAAPGGGETRDSDQQCEHPVASSVDRPARVGTGRAPTKDFAISG
jgi:hypothetical protein